MHMSIYQAGQDQAIANVLQGAAGRDFSGADNIQDCLAADQHCPLADAAGRDDVLAGDCPISSGYRIFLEA
jgi:hypothetical protein